MLFNLCEKQASRISLEECEEFKTLQPKINYIEIR